MTPVTCMAGKTLAIFGLGGSGLATARALKAGGATPVCWDDTPAKVEEARREGFETQDLRSADWSRFAALILSPGVPLTHPAPHWTVPLARSANVEVIGDIELFCRERTKIAPDAPFIAITGTNGKSTTTALIAHILCEAGMDAQMGGNIGTPILALEPPAENRFHVVEMSSFQIDLTPSFLGDHVVPGMIGVLLNITPDHLDRHGTMDQYAAIKERLIESANLAIIGVDDSLSHAIAERRAGAERPYVPITTGDYPHGILASGTRLIRREPGADDRAITDIAGIASLRGAHNAQNAAAAAAVALALGCSLAAIARGLRTFPGLPHRMEEVGRLGRTIFVNDSKATNADSTEKALAAFEIGIFWILGGKAKEGGITSLSALFGHVEKAYLIGAATEDFAATLTQGGVAFERAGTLDVALAHAARDAAASQAKEPVVLLSPACASYDQFANFGERGDRFRTMAKALISQAQAADPTVEPTSNSENGPPISDRPPPLPSPPLASRAGGGRRTAPEPREAQASGHSLPPRSGGEGKGGGQIAKSPARSDRRHRKEP